MKTSPPPPVRTASPAARRPSPTRLRPAPSALSALPARRLCRRSRSLSSAPLLLPISSLSHRVWCRLASSRTVDARSRPATVDPIVDVEDVEFECVCPRECCDNVVDPASECRLFGDVSCCGGDVGGSAENCMCTHVISKILQKTIAEWHSPSHYYFQLPTHAAKAAVACHSLPSMWGSSASLCSARSLSRSRFAQMPRPRAPRE